MHDSQFYRDKVRVINAQCHNPILAFDIVSLKPTKSKLSGYLTAKETRIVFLKDNRRTKHLDMCQELYKCTITDTIKQKLRIFIV